MAVVALCLIHYLLAVASVLNKSNTYDEIAHLTRGYSYFLTGDYRLEPPHPPLAHIWAALPGLGTNVKFPNTWKEHETWHTSDVWQIGRAFFYYTKSGNASIIDNLLWRGRAMIALLSVALGLLVYYASSKLFGQTGGLMSLGFYAFSPTMLAHGRLVTTDCVAALFFAASLLSIWWMLHRVSVASVLGSSLSLAGLFLAKMSAVLIIPVGMVMLAARLLSRRPLKIRIGKFQKHLGGTGKQAGCFGIVLVVWIAMVWASIWAAYGFRYDSMLDAEAGRDRYYCPTTIPQGQDVWQWQLRKLDHLQPIVSFLRDHRLFPEAYIYSAVMSAQTARGRFAFLNGSVDKLGHRWFFLWAFLLKTPLPLIAFLLAILVLPFFRARSVTASTRSDALSKDCTGVTDWKTWAYRTTPLWSFFAIYWIASLRTHLNIGHRHILPIYPILFVFCGSASIYVHRGLRWIRLSMLVMMGLFVAASLWTFPNYLTYFNAIAGGSKSGYRNLVDSSLDWGQDLPAIRDYVRRLEAGDNVAPIYLSYFGSGGSRAIQHFEIEAIALPQTVGAKAAAIEPYRAGTYLISATHLQQVYQSYQGRSLHDASDDLERQYRSLTNTVAGFPLSQSGVESTTSPSGSNAGQPGKRCTSLTFARLCRFLRSREPDDWINHSVLVYRLSDEDLRTAFE